LIEPPKPPDEKQRLETLRGLGVLDTPAEERFDRVTRLAQRLFGVPIVLVSLVDAQRQWFKSRQGLAASETPRDISFCGHAILGDEILLVTDTHDDVRFHDNPLVTGDPNIRFYAGAPLRAPDGHTLGTLCLIDREPRSFGDDERETLVDLAGIVERELVAIRMATLDELTGLCNRRGFEMIAKSALAGCRRAKVPATILFVDMDGFKQINDEFGHGEGDRALREMACCLHASFRDSDVIARLGGDEFCVFLAGTGEADLKSPIERLARHVESVNGSREWQLRYSLGSASADLSETREIADLIREADERMYEAKRERRASRVLKYP